MKNLVSDWKAKSILGAGPLLVISLLTSACFDTMAHKQVRVEAPATTGVTWTPPAGEAPQLLPPMVETGPKMPPLATDKSWSLVELADYALKTNPRTREAWQAARSAAAAMRSKEGAYLPWVDFYGSLNETRSAAPTGTSTQLGFGPSVAVNYLLLDFGGRRANVEEARQTLLAAGYTHNATIQDVLQQLAMAYTQYLSARALMNAEESAVKAAQTTLDSAEERHRAGVATIADVLQAKAALAQTRLTLQSTQGQVMAVQGALATAVGMPATTKFEVSDLPTDLPLLTVSDEVAKLIEKALTNRPDLAAMRAQAEKATAHIRKVESEGRPAVTAAGSASETFTSSTDHFYGNFVAGVTLHIPIFTGHSQKWNEIQARADAQVAQEQYSSQEQAITLQVWTSYYGVKTAEQKIRTAAELIDSAQQSYEVALGRYKAGVGNILDLTTTQSVLENARALQIGARSDWFLSLIQLAHDTGALDLQNLK